MKTVQIVIGFCFLLALPIVTSAQADTRTNNDNTVATNQCDALVGSVTAKLQAKANSTCETVKYPIRCTAGPNDYPVFMILTVQPDPNVCDRAAVVNSVTTDQVRSRGATATFDFEVLQRDCNWGGTTLTVYLPETEERERNQRYDFKWKVGDKVMDTDDTADCVPNGTRATITVTDKETGGAVTKEIALDYERGGRD